MSSEMISVVIEESFIDRLCFVIVLIISSVEESKMMS